MRGLMGNHSDRRAPCLAHARLLRTQLSFVVRAPQLCPETGTLRRGSSDGGELLASPAAAEQPGWPMDMPEGQAGGPAAKMYLWDQAEDGNLETPLSLEEQILNSTFEACDPQRTGTVAVSHLLAYLEAVTGRGPQDARLQTLACSLDPNGEGPQATVDLDTFLVVMRDWITACQLDGQHPLDTGTCCGWKEAEKREKGSELEEEAAFGGALASRQLPSGCPEVEDPANLESFGGEDPRPELPATADLLSSLEDLELSNRRLAGENAKLQRSVETAEEGSARLGEEISALRKQLRSTQQALQFARGVDEELEDLKTLAKSLEEQNHSLLAQARYTEKEQQRLVAEMETLQEENGKLLAERDGVKRRSEELVSEKDILKRQLYECERLICQRDAILSEELRLEISHLEEQLSQTQEGLDELSEGAQVRRADCTNLMPPSLGVEIQAIQQKREETAVDLSSPLCGVWPWEKVVSETDEEDELPPETPAEEQGNFQGESAHPQEGGEEQLTWLPRREEEDGAEIQVMVDLPIHPGDSHPEDILGNPPESSPSEPELQQALVPVVKELVPVRRPVWGQLCLCPPRPQLLRVARLLLIPVPLLGLLLLLVFTATLLSQSPPPTWPHLQLCYLQPPPV
ncbi:protein KASH5 isoform X4 [Odocoileus virginianus]|uniref:Protein KASH5 isoform X4 n=1 Tax=Odocoileus virginianus TaxID=9874 RepID=A0ABM4GTH9_ODOVR